MTQHDPGDVVVNITPQSQSLAELTRELWRYREVLWVLAARDVKIRYKQTVFGVAWALFQPFLSMVVFSVVFGRLAKIPSDGVPYPVFVYAGLLPWTFFSGAFSSSANALMNMSGLLSKVYFPRLLVPLAPLGAHLVDLGVASSILFGLLLFYKVPLTPSLLALPLLVVMLLVLAVGIGALVSAVLVRFRDLRIVLPYATQALLFASPVVWGTNLVPDRFRPYLYLNPLAGLIDAVRSSVLGQPFNWSAIGTSAAVSVALFVAGMLVFLKLERRAVDIL